MARRVNLLDPDMLQTALLVFAVVCAVAIGLAILDRVRRLLVKPDDEETMDLRTAMEHALDSEELDETEKQRVREVLDRKFEGESSGPEPKVPRF